MEMAVLLSLMIGSGAEDFQLYQSCYSCFVELKPESDVLLENVRSVIKQMTVSTFALSCHWLFRIFLLLLHLHIMIKYQ